LTTLGIIGFFILLIACVNFINLQPHKAPVAPKRSAPEGLGSLRGHILAVHYRAACIIPVCGGALRLDGPGWPCSALTIVTLQSDAYPLRDKQLMLLFFLMVLSSWEPAATRH